LSFPQNNLIRWLRNARKFERVGKESLSLFIAYLRTKYVVPSGGCLLDGTVPRHDAETSADKA
jgi:hypothetical protein